MLLRVMPGRVLSECDRADGPAVRGEYRGGGYRVQLSCAARTRFTTVEMALLGWPPGLKKLVVKLAYHRQMRLRDDPAIPSRIIGSLPSASILTRSIDLASSFQYASSVVAGTSIVVFVGQRDERIGERQHAPAAAMPLEQGDLALAAAVANQHLLRPDERNQPVDVDILGQKIEYFRIGLERAHATCGPTSRPRT